MERLIERGLFASRWLLAPFYIGLVGTLVVMLIKFAQELWHFITHLWGIEASDTILATLSLSDLSLAANLVLIVVFSGYENFVSKIDVGDHEDMPSWKGKVDFTGLKIKLIASMVAISGIHLLKVFMDIGKYQESEIRWMVTIHIVFVGSGLCLAIIEHLITRSKLLLADKA